MCGVAFMLKPQKRDLPCVQVDDRDNAGFRLVADALLEVCFSLETASAD